MFFLLSLLNSYLVQGPTWCLLTHYCTQPPQNRQYIPLEERAPRLNDSLPRGPHNVYFNQNVTQRPKDSRTDDNT